MEQIGCKYYFMLYKLQVFRKRHQLRDCVTEQLLYQSKAIVPIAIHNHASGIFCMNLT